METNEKNDIVLLMSIFLKKPILKILFVATEATPFIKAGGLGEVMFSLPQSLVELGHDARVMIPRYADIDSAKFELTMELKDLEVPTDAEGEEKPEYLICNVKKFTPKKDDPRSMVTAYFLENMEYYEQRANVYGYADDASRWALLSRGVLEFLRASNWKPDVIMCADWQTGFLPNYLKTVYKNDPFLKSIATVFSIHNLYYQGMFDHRFVSDADYDGGQAPIGSFFNSRLGKLNGMRRGIMYSDLIITVSPNYAKEIMTPEYGELLDGLLRENRSRVYGVINALDYEVFNPKTDPNLAENYEIGEWNKRKKNKAELQKRFGMKQGNDYFLTGIVSRLVEQKGFDLLLPVLEPILKELRLQLIVVGSGESKYMSFFQNLEKNHPGQVAAHLTFDKILPHLVYAGADAVLIPSKFEPSGLTQMEAMRYGCVPIARKTGGLADTVEDYNGAENSGTGFLFESFDSLPLIVAITRAYENFYNSDAWNGIQSRAMKKDFSWGHSAMQYGKLFKTASALAAVMKTEL